MENSINKKRPDIAKMMYKYNKKYNIYNENNPESIAEYSTQIIKIICPNGHIHQKTAERITRTKTDQSGTFICPDCRNNGLIKETEPLKGITLKEFCNTTPEYKHLLDEWDYELNEIKPNEITTGSEKKVFWRCQQNHSYMLDVFSRARRGRNCPYCSGRKLLKGFNDLASQNPEILKDWNYDKNDVRPDEIFQHAKRKVWWKCHKCGHEWEAAVCRRTTNIQTGCPNCHGRATSLPEMCLYIALKNVFQDVEHRKIIDGLEYDIVINDINLAIEYDGIKFHGEGIGKREKLKEKTAQKHGLNFIRVKETSDKTMNGKVKKNTLYISEQHRHHHNKTCELTLKLINQLYDTNVNCVVDKNITINARSAIDLTRKENSVATMCPEHAKEWYQPLNGNVKPEYVPHGNATTLFWWKCSKCGHIYQKTPYDKRNSFRDGGCIKCKTVFHKTGVVCITTNEFFDSIANASRAKGVHASTIMACCKGRIKNPNTFNWRYATIEEIESQKVLNT